MPGRIITRGSNRFQPRPVRQIGLAGQPCLDSLAGQLNFPSGSPSCGLREDRGRRLADGAGLAPDPDTLDPAFFVERQAKAIVLPQLRDLASPLSGRASSHG